MTTSIKDKNKRWLAVVVVANVLVIYLAIKTNSLFANGLVVLINEWQDALPAGLAVLAVTLLSGLLSRETKARVVFWKWNYPLPSREAFSYHAINDQTIDLQALESAHGPLPTDAASQSELWYKIYRKHRDEPAAFQVNRDFVLMTDWCAISLLFLPILGVAGFVFIASNTVAFVYLLLLLSQYLLTMIAARNYGVSLVRTVLAIESSS